MERFSATIGTLSSSHLDPRIVLIVENDQPGCTLTIDIPGLAVLHGLGDSATNLITLRWLQTADRVLYWVTSTAPACKSLPRYAAHESRHKRC